jgi:hypothetical protein
MLVEGYYEKVARALRSMLGEQAALAILFHTGKPDDPMIFEAKLASIFGDGTCLILERIQQELQH